MDSKPNAAYTCMQSGNGRGVPVPEIPSDLIANCKALVWLILIDKGIGREDDLRARSLERTKESHVLTPNTSKVWIKPKARVRYKECARDQAIVGIGDRHLLAILRD